MRNLLLLMSLIGLFMYTGFVMAENPSVPAGGSLPNQESRQTETASGLAPLNAGLKAAGADLEAVLITGWSIVPTESAQIELARAFGWTDTPAAADEVREVYPYQRGGVRYIGFRWFIPQGTGWQQRAETVRHTLSGFGASYGVTVQLEGTTARSDLQAVANDGLNALKATGHQPWTGPRAASIAARSAALPAGPFDVNVQIAARRDEEAGLTRVWIAWPALNQEY